MARPAHQKDTSALSLFSLRPQQKQIVDAIREQGILSRTDLARITGSSRAKITLVVNKLVESGILSEIGDGDSQGGRRPRMLSFNTGLGFIGAVDVGATSLDIALTNFGGQILERHEEPADVRDGPDVMLGRICTILNSMIERRGISAMQVYAIGIGVPGPVEFSTGLLITPPIMPGWGMYPIRDFMRLSFPAARVMVDNDVNVMALGELRAGAGYGVDNFIFIKIGTGIGAGIVCNGVVYRGSNGCAGDIGHICADTNGVVCHCGNIGCLEAMAAAPAISARALTAAETGRSEFLARRLRDKGTPLTAEDVGAAAAAGDRVAIEIIQDSGRMIGETLAGLVNFFNPRLIFIGGGISNVGHALLSSIRQAVLRRSLPLSTKDLRIDYSTLGGDAGIQGAMSLAMEHVFTVEA